MNTINLKLIVIVVLLLLAGTTITLAQHDHSSHSKSHSQPATSPMSNPPHGGMIRMTGKYHIEMVVNMWLIDDKVTIFLLDKKGETLPIKDITGTVMFMFDDNTTSKEQLVARGDELFIAQLKDSKPFTAMVSLKIKGKTVSASFQHEGLNDIIGTATYTCPMKCEGEKTYYEPGKCPKCKMNLVKSDKKEKLTYTCPMHPEIQSKEPGSCPKCKMNLVKRK